MTSLNHLYVGHAAQVPDEVEPHTADPPFVQAPIVGVLEGLVHNRDAAIPTAAVRNRIEHRSVVRAMAARLNDDGPLDPQHRVQRGEALPGASCGV